MSPLELSQDFNNVLNLLEKERKNLEAEKLLSLDINVLFKSLAKLIHPDTEQDPILRARKLKLMTRLSGARDNMNIAEILEIKMQVDELMPNNQTDVSFNDSKIARLIFFPLYYTFK
jgi:hypothetical protein